MDPDRPHPASGRPLGLPPGQSNRASKTGGHGANLSANTSGNTRGPSQQTNSAPRPAAAQNHAPEQPHRQGPVLVFKGASAGRGPRVQEHNRTLLRKAASGVPRFVPGAPSAVPPRNYEWIPHKSPAVRPLQADLDEMFASGVVRKRFGDELNDPLGTRVLSVRGRGSPVKRATPARKVMHASRLEGGSLPRPSRMVAMSSVPRDRTPSDDEDIDIIL
ncbi:hypothetical protein OBBRIDRAFT_177229 [Obba rivulosa]|uniref:Uncharacterized protein n=1 Tax=Obba rivulosa TaxID=1052685 RepID=A0A8E2AXB7_9APHY|nr:hypothetical protein OBBRIDRAFT_177229 [Obba rivulosa]